MDPLKIIKNQIDEVVKLENSLVGLNSVLTHIERAEFLLNHGLENDDEHFYTDVIYRTNHAFEGILKEAYRIFADKEPDKKTPFEIEKFLLENQVLNSRVVDLLKNYRENWRNPSTHDYNLFFNYSEAFLAIITISAFVHVLLNQILEKISYYKEKDNLEKKKGFKNELKLEEDKNFSLLERVRTILLNFVKRNYSKDFEAVRKGVFWTEILGSLKAYIEASDQKIKIDLEPVIQHNKRKIRPDLIVIRGSEKLIVEIKIFRRDRRFLVNFRLYEDQMISYLLYTKINSGILLLLPNEMYEDDEYLVREREIEIGNEKIRFLIIYLKDSISKSIP